MQERKVTRVWIHYDNGEIDVQDIDGIYRTYGNHQTKPNSAVVVDEWVVHELRWHVHSQVKEDPTKLALLDAEDAKAMKGTVG